MNQARLTSIVLAAVGAGALGLAYTAQFGFGLEPCVLCLYQRVPYALVAILGFVGLMRPHLVPNLLILAALVFACGAIIAAYHVGVEQHWWASATGCSGNTSQTTTTLDLIQSMQVKPPKACDAVDWTVLGVSMAGWNVLFSIVCGVASLFARTRLKET